MEQPKTIDNVFKGLKQKYPDMDLTRWALRQLVKEGKIPCMKVGSKQLITEEAVERYVNSQLGV